MGQDVNWRVVERYDASEQDVLIEEFIKLLRSATKDGGEKRARGMKPPWWNDPSHKAAVFSHFAKHERGERVDPDSGVHPYVHAAWRLLAISYQEMYGQIDPVEKNSPVMHVQV